MTDHCQIHSSVAKVSDAAEKILLDGETLSPEVLVKIGYNPQFPVDLSEEAWEAVNEGRAVVDRIIERKEVVYGINTGFGNFANVIIPFEQLKQLQENLIRSHSSGVGNPLTPNQTRMLLTLRINVLAKGHSGIRPETVRQMLDALNANCLSFVPAKGTVGASGDLAPLSHLALGLMGEGQMWEPRSQQYMAAAEVLKMHGLKPITLHAKEGLALINGTQLITSVGSEAVVRAQRIARQADVVAALTVEALKASGTPFHPAIHKARPHTGQIRVAGRMRNLLNFGGAPSEISRSHINCGKVQDSYTLRCIPQVHGIVHDTVNFSHDILFTECNSATDNPMIFADLRAQPMSNSSVARVNGFYPYKLDGEDEVTNANVSSVVSCVNCDGVCKADQDAAASSASSSSISSSSSASASPCCATTANNTPVNPDVTASKSVEVEESKTPSSHPADVSQGIILSGGNFHGEYPAKALDYLTIGIHEIASISERRIERLVNPALSGLPAFLTEGGGLNSGFMIAHCAAAALVSENKTLCHPASVDSISTSAAQEDHVSMGGFAARKALKVVGHVEYCIAVELLCACQAIDFLRPLTTTKPLEAVHKLVRSVAPHWEKDRFMSPDIEAVAKLLRENKIWAAVAPFVDEQFH